MQIGCNYSVELLQLLDEKRVDVDYIKIAIDDVCKDHLEIAKAAKPIMVHYMGHEERATMKDFNRIDFNWINERLTYLKSPISALHCYVEKEDFDTEDPSYEEVIARLEYVLGHWKNKLCVPLTIENYPYSAYYDSLGNHSLTSEPQLFHEMCEQINLNITLDIGHAKVSASHKGKTLKSYLSEFPLNRVIELHVNGTFNDPVHGIKDKHLEMEEDDYEIIEWLLAKCQIKYLTLEYGGVGRPKLSGRSDINAIERQLKRLYGLAK
ncbi:multinuclear nonheme iron-dependent oxidase [Brassicibacter mesophilus]|uniref:multinuclear nonheme iron-dependent oxidase n=1 Tax=Brassicibacter mesophilus TaxID=745119 RepID=UPI003D1EB7D8